MPLAISRKVHLCQATTWFVTLVLALSDIHVEVNYCLRNKDVAQEIVSLNVEVSFIIDSEQKESS